MSDGRVLALPDAHRTDGDHPAMGVMAVSPDGTRAAYLRGSDGALMIWEAATGKARRTEVTKPDSVRITGLTVSPRGRFVGVEGEYESRALFRDRVVDTATGKTFTLPRGYTLARFSPDDRHLMATHRSGAVVYATGTWSVKLRRSAYMTGDLGRDGVTVAKASRNDARPSGNRVTVRNLATGKKRAFPLRLRRGEAPYRARWDAAGRLDVLTDSYRGPSGRESHTYTWYRLDRRTGRLRVLDSFVVTSAVGDVILAG
ncbi:WD40 repeat domain-containing protein [Planomonospora alba]|uniref:WD40 repeat domain-containing protein n=1 Tax=Planomonospora alba TaxID=161354 RepID=UPI0031E9A680